MMFAGVFTRSGDNYNNCGTLEDVRVTVDMGVFNEFKDDFQEQFEEND